MHTVKSKIVALEFAYKFGLFLNIGGTLAVCIIFAMKAGAFDLKRFYVILSLFQWPMWLIHYWYTCQEVKSFRQNGLADFWLDGEEFEFFEEMHEEGVTDESYYSTLPLSRRRIATINHGLNKAFWPTFAAWLVSAICSKLFLGKHLQAIITSLIDLKVPGGIITLTLANFGALSVGLPLYRKYRDQANRDLPHPPLVTMENIRHYMGRSHL